MKKALWHQTLTVKLKKRHLDDHLEGFQVIHFDDKLLPVIEYSKFLKHTSVIFATVTILLMMVLCGCLSKSVNPFLLITIIIRVQSSKQKINTAQVIKFSF